MREVNYDKMAEAKAGPDMENRDPNDLNSHVKVAFEEVLGEPEGVRSIDCVWQCSYTCFTCSLNCCYKFLTCLCGVPIALYWGCEFACLAFCQIWECTPMLRKLAIECITVRKLVTLMLDIFLGPCCETCGLLFSKIAVKNQS